MLDKPPRAKGQNTRLTSAVWGLLAPYSHLVHILVVITALVCGLSLVIPKLISRTIDSYSGHGPSVALVAQFTATAFAIFALSYGQVTSQVYISEHVARDIRQRIVTEMLNRDPRTTQSVAPETILTTLLSDVDAVKVFISQMLTSMLSSVFLLIGSSVLLLVTNWRVGIVVLTMFSGIAVISPVLLRKSRPLFTKSQASVDWLNKVVNERILAAPLVRLLHSENSEAAKFRRANRETRRNSLNILRHFAKLFPALNFCTNVVTLQIFVLGGYFVIVNSMTLGAFTAFNAYLAILVFPLGVILGAGNVVSRAAASYERIATLMPRSSSTYVGRVQANLCGHIVAEHVYLRYGETMILKDVSFSIRPGSRTAIIGPTGAGKSQLLYLLVGLTLPNSGFVKYDNCRLEDYDVQSLRLQIGLVFQDPIVFNLTLRDNIVLNAAISPQSVEQALATAELTAFIGTLPQGLDTVVTERGTSLSGGQKQRIMLARALASNPKVLLLDDFTARVDLHTEETILNNIRRNYPTVTTVTVTQKIASVRDYDQLILLMDGEVLASGTHEELMRTSPEYVQIYESQQTITRRATAR